MNRIYLNAFLAINGTNSCDLQFLKWSVAVEHMVNAYPFNGGIRYNFRKLLIKYTHHSIFNSSMHLAIPLDYVSVSVNIAPEFSALQLWNIMQTFTHWGRVTHICVNKLTVFGSDNGSSPGRHQAIIWTNAGILLIGTLGTHFSEILIEIRPFSFKKMHLKMSSAKWRPSCFGLNVLSQHHTPNDRTHYLLLVG